MKVVAALDSFKGSLSSLEAGNAVREGVLRAVPEAEVLVLPLADGGEGTADALLTAMGGEWVFVSVTGPLGDSIAARYGRAGSVALIEMAQAAGLPLVPQDRRDPMHTTTRGVGELIAHAAANGCREFILGIGGSATNDGGIGMLSALGVRFLDSQGQILPGYGRDLEAIAGIDTGDILPVLRECRFRVACDVDNPLCGPRGASAIYGPQKGLTPTGIECMDKALAQYAAITANCIQQDFTEYKGAGAAGGLGFACLSYLGAELKSGVELVLDAIGFSEKVKGADVFITGEGRMDAQTAMGKAPAGAAARAKAAGATVIAFVGGIAGVSGRNCPPMDAVFSIQPGPVSLPEAMEPSAAAKNLSDTAEQVFSLILHLQKKATHT